MTTTNLTKVIPKIIHYCWFGRNPLPKSAKKCIASWRKYLPDYEIKEWNEDNFDVNIIPYTRDAYQAKKYAFVSDYARFWILYHFGGVYFDTDVEVIRSIDDILENGGFMGMEISSSNIERRPVVNPGVGMASEAGTELIEEILHRYASLSFYTAEGERNPYSMIPMVSEILIGNGLKDVSQPSSVCGITVFPNDFFNPFDGITGRLCITNNTRSIHWYAMSWLNIWQRLKLRIGRIFRSIYKKC